MEGKKYTLREVWEKLKKEKASICGMTLIYGGYPIQDLKTFEELFLYGQEYIDCRILGCTKEELYKAKELLEGGKEPLLCGLPTKKKTLCKTVVGYIDNLEDALKFIRGNDLTHKQWKCPAHN